jgi:sugar phosphate permease
MIIYVRMPVSEAYIVGQISEQNRSTILGIYYFSVMEGGGVLTPVMGYLIDHLGFHSSFTIAGASLVALTLVCSIWLWGSRD